jgi:SAM-dependent methyltransferase
VTFEVSAEAYAAFMGRYSSPLAAAFADLVGVGAEQDALDVGCGAGALTDVLVQRLGADHVAAVDPSESFVAAVARKHPGVRVQRASAEQLPFPDAVFDRVLAQLVVHFMADPVSGLAEMARVTRPGGVVAANVWDHAGGGGPLATFWRAARSLDPDSPDESGLAGVAEGHLAKLFAAAAMPGASSTKLSVQVSHPTFEQWWEPFTFGVGPAGQHVVRLRPEEQTRLRDRCRSLLPPAPFTVNAVAWTVSWTKPQEYDAS